MKTKLFNVIYSVTMSYEAQVRAKDKKEAVSKVREVIGEPVQIEFVYRLTRQATHEGV